MQVKNIRTSKDIEKYIEGCLNDYELRISTKEQTLIDLCELVAYVYNNKPTNKTYAERLYDGLKGNDYE